MTPVSSKRAKRRAECEGKEALDAAAAYARQTLLAAKGQVLDVYPCPHGEHWHVGHRPRPRTRVRLKMQRQKGRVR